MKKIKHNKKKDYKDTYDVPDVIKNGTFTLNRVSSEELKKRRIDVYPYIL